MPGFIEVKIDIQSALKEMGSIVNEQFPFGYALALTRVAVAGRMAAMELTRREFHLHTEFVPQGIWVDKALKSDIKNHGYAYSKVYTAPIISAWMPLQETGDKKRPRKRALSIPGRYLESLNYKDSKGHVLENFKPNELLKHFNATRGSSKGLKYKAKGQNVPTPFILKGYIVIRSNGLRRSKLQTIYSLRKDAKIKPKWNFEKTINMVVSIEWESILIESMMFALRTGRD